MRKLFLLEDDLSLISGLTFARTHKTQKREGIMRKLFLLQETGLCTGYSSDAGRSRGAVVRRKI